MQGKNEETITKCSKCNKQNQIEIAQPQENQKFKFCLNCGNKTKPKPIEKKEE